MLKILGILTRRIHETVLYIARVDTICDGNIDINGECPYPILELPDEPRLGVHTG